MNKNILRRIFAIIALVAAVCMAVFVPLYFFNMFGDLSGAFGALATASVCVTAVFFILAYILKPRETDLGKPEEELCPPTDGETDADENNVGDDHDIIPNGNGNEERED